MLKSVLDLQGLKVLSKKDQQALNAGSPPNCWVVCPDYALRVCNTLNGIYTGECDCNCY
ncbi:hypothetical protein [Aquimarina sp. 2201CG5-10]|uniref:hypothetical protein n=1 Tax=Aquimarina callyspongiae TaxID=3098150 RepID=UPI002AB4E5B4|nr:hypothetical protein [Aquimarina sp. 2201CG5-10]MDY8134284.1 hypothetical protein [Aquimarina sp. 2201CG5-10]